MMLVRPFTSDKSGASFPFCVNSAAGFHLCDENGVQILDAISGMWHTPFGYGHPELTHAVYEQCNILSASSLFSVSHQPAVSYAEALCRALGLPDWRVHLTNNGADAVEAAIRFASACISGEGCEPAAQALPGGFHGNSHFLQTLPRKPVPHRCARDVRHIIVFEPIQGVAGVRRQDPQTCAALLAASRDGAIIIADETGSGMWRTGPALASTGLGLEPDIIIVSKGLTNGMVPLAATLVSPGIAARMSDATWEDGRTTAGTPLACAAGLKVLDLLMGPKVRDNLTIGGGRLADLICAVASEFSGSARHFGMMAGVELPLRRALTVVERAEANAVFIKHGLLARFAADGRTVNLAPGYTFDKSDFDELEYRMFLSIRELCVSYV